MARNHNPLSPLRGRGTDSRSPWSAAFTFAVLRLGLAPSEFWRLSLTEWRTLIGAASPQGDALGAPQLHDLMKHYPDKEQ